MSSVAEFRLIDVNKLNLLEQAAEIKITKTLFSKKIVDNYYDYLETNTKFLSVFDGTGYAIVNLFIFLEQEKEIDLLESTYSKIADSISEKRNCSTFILTYDHKSKYFEKLSPENYTLQELIKFNTVFSEENDSELATEQMHGLKVIQESLDILTDLNQVILLSIG